MVNHRKINVGKNEKYSRRKENRDLYDQTYHRHAQRVIYISRF